jgi:hypothetical protein
MTGDERCPSDRIELADLICLIGESSTHYADTTIPHERDLAIVALLGKARRGGGLEQLLDLIRPEVEAETLRAFGVRMASLAVRRAEPDLLRLGLLAVAVASLRSMDRRDDLLALAPLWRTASLLRLDPPHEFTAAAVELPGAAEFLLGWVDRSPERQDLMEMGFRESTDEDGFRYVEDATVFRRILEEDYARRPRLIRLLSARQRRRWLRENGFD